MVMSVRSQKTHWGTCCPCGFYTSAAIRHASSMTAAAVMAVALGDAQSGSLLGQSGVDPLTLYMSKFSRSQLNDVMSEFKVISTPTAANNSKFVKNSFSGVQNEESDEYIDLHKIFGLWINALTSIV